LYWLGSHPNRHSTRRMSLGGFLFALLAAWCTVHILYFLNKHRRSSLLPVFSGPDSILGATRVTLSGLHLRISTTKWNARHDKVIAFFARRRNRRLNALLVTMYNFGILLGALGMIIAFLLCLSGVWHAIAERLVADGSSNLFKRLVEDTHDFKPLTPAPARFPIVTPIVSDSGDLPWHTDHRSRYQVSPSL
jgi:hypothetical protein